MTEYAAGIFLRGEYLEENLVQFGGRYGDLAFSAPDPHKYVDRLAVGSPRNMMDLYDLGFEDILDYLEELGSHLDVNRNEYLDWSRKTCYPASPATPPLIDASYESIPYFFERQRLREFIEKPMGSTEYIEGWVRHRLADGQEFSVRAFGSRTLHIPAGNSTIPSVMSVIWSALTRCDAIIKCPSNEPFLPLAIARTMGEMAPDHPITRHFSVAYWKGGDEKIEKRLYAPHSVEKILAWGGFSSLKHVAKYIQPGLELIPFDPKRSAAIIGREAFESEEAMRDAAQRAAADIGALNQLACTSGRVFYAACGIDDAGIEKLNRLGQYVYEALLELPSHVSTKPKSMDGELKNNLESLRMVDDWYRVIGGRDEEGAIVVSQVSDPVEFAGLLNDRVGNFVPLDEVEESYRYFDAYTQTVGVYPDGLMENVRETLPIYGVQRIVPLGYMTSGGSFAGPHDALEPVRRMCKWIVNNHCDIEKVPPVWQAEGMWKDMAKAVS